MKKHQIKMVIGVFRKLVGVSDLQVRKDIF